MMQGCATLTNDSNENPGDISKTLPPTAAGIGVEPKVFKSEQEAAKDLTGYNYGLANQSDGSVKAYVAGLAGSGADNPITQSHPLHSNQDSVSLYYSGQDAIDSLTPQEFEALAENQGVTTDFLEEQLLQDDDLKIDGHGRLLYVDTMLFDPQVGSTIVAHPAPVLPETDVYKLHSRPGASKVLYLDFTGPLIEAGSLWLGGRQFQAAPYSTDIYPIWAGVADDYSGFDVDVTTEKPSNEALYRSNFEDQSYGFTVVISGSTDMSICNGTCGGVAYLGVFNSVNNKSVQPAWVFTEMYPQENRVKYISDVISHESGHSLGLCHKGIGPHEGFNNTEIYYAGRYHATSSANTAFLFKAYAPIMGKGYYAVLSHWSDGDYVWSNNRQSDLATIEQIIPRVAADASSSKESAIPFGIVSISGNKSNIEKTVGNISSTDDIDYFTFTVEYDQSEVNLLLSNCIYTECSKPEDFDLGNLHIFATLYDAEGNVVKEFNQNKTPSIQVKTTLSPGIYYLAISSGSMAKKVSSTSESDFYNNGDYEGYSALGSIGQYAITGYYSAGPVAITPTGVIDVSSASGDAPLQVSFNSDRTDAGYSTIVSYAWDFGNGQTSTEKNPSITFNNAGTYQISLTVQNQAGYSHTANTTIHVATYTGQTTSVKTLTLKTKDSTKTTITPYVIIALKNKQGKADHSSVVTGTFSGNLIGFGPISVQVTSVYNAKAKRIEANFPDALPKKVKGTLIFKVDSIAPATNSIKYVSTKNAKTSVVKTF
jgi:PKD repeat protein